MGTADILVQYYIASWSFAGFSLYNYYDLHSEPSSLYWNNEGVFAILVVIVTDS